MHQYCKYENTVHASCDFHTKDVQIMVSHQVSFNDVKGYVTSIYDGAWWIAYATGTDPEMQEVTLSFIHMGLAGHFTIHTKQYILNNSSYK